MRKLQFYLLDESLFYPSAIDSPKLIFSGCYIFSDSFADSSTFTIDTDLGLVIEEKRGRTEKARLQVFFNSHGSSEHFGIPLSSSSVTVKSYFEPEQTENIIQK